MFVCIQFGQRVSHFGLDNGAAPQLSFFVVPARLDFMVHLLALRRSRWLLRLVPRQTYIGNVHWTHTSAEGAHSGSVALYYINSRRSGGVTNLRLY